MTIPIVSIVIPNYQGVALLPRTLGHLQRILAADGMANTTEVIVVDDGSTDGSAALVRESHAWVRLVALASNLGFSGAMNRGIDEARAPLVYCMNSDVFPEPGFLRAPLERFRAERDLFGVMSANVDPAGALLPPNQTAPELKRGMIRVRGADLDAAWSSGALREHGAVPTLFASGGSALVDRARMLELGGFAEIFRPYYYEDTDLGWRAWRRGWRTMFEPASVVLHDHARGTIASTQRERHVAAHRKRNRFLLLWRNVLDRRLLWGGHLVRLPLFLAGRALAFDGATLRGFCSALGQLGAVREHRKRERAAEKMPTREIFGLLAHARRELIRGVEAGQRK